MGWVTRRGIQVWEGDHSELNRKFTTHLTVGKPDPRLKPCGTPAAARRHARRGEPLCDPCRQAKRITENTYYLLGEWISPEVSVGGNR